MFPGRVVLATWRFLPTDAPLSPFRDFPAQSQGRPFLLRGLPDTLHCQVSPATNCDRRTSPHWSWPKTIASRKIAFWCGYCALSAFFHFSTRSFLFFPGIDRFVPHSRETPPLPTLDVALLTGCCGSGRRILSEAFREISQLDVLLSRVSSNLPCRPYANPHKGDPFSPV